MHKRARRITARNAPLGCSNGSGAPGAIRGDMNDAGARDGCLGDGPAACHSASRFRPRSETRITRRVKTHMRASIARRWEAFRRPSGAVTENATQAPHRGHLRALLVLRRWPKSTHGLVPHHRYRGCRLGHCACGLFKRLFGGLVFLGARLSPAAPTLLLLSIASVLLHPLR